MGYKEAKINFYPDRITYIGNKLEGISEEAKQEIEDRLGTDFSLDDYLANESEELIIMMSWEHPVMQRSAEFVCENGGDILEIGFGMGIASDYIQSYNPSSHTIIEMHPELAEKAREWASDKVNVTIIEGDWNLQRDVVLMIHIISHMSALMLNQILSQIHIIFLNLI